MVARSPAVQPVALDRLNDDDLYIYDASTHEMLRQVGSKSPAPSLTTPAGHQGACAPASLTRRCGGMSTPNTNTVLDGCACAGPWSSTVADKSMRDGPVQQWLIVSTRRCHAAAMHGMQPVQSEGGARHERSRPKQRGWRIRA